MSSLKSSKAENNIKMEVTNPEADPDAKTLVEGTPNKPSDFENGKRTNEGNDIPPTKRQKLFEPGFHPSKNAICQLNELGRDVKYTIEPASGPAHCPIFLCSAIVNGEKFTSMGTSKKLAKHAAAELALKSFIQTPTAFKSSTRAPIHIDFTADNIDADSSDCFEPRLCQNVSKNLIVQRKINKKLHKLADIGKKDPVVLLNEICPALPYIVTKEDPTCKEQRFVMSVTVDGETFEASGPSKRAAKAATAQAVLAQKYKVNLSMTDKIQPLVSSVEVFDFSQALASKMGKLIEETIGKVVSGIKNCPKGDVHAGIVMTKDEAMEDMEVVCFATGSKRLSGENMSLIGAVLTDSHAEVVARRCLKDFFFAQLELHASDKGHESIFEKVNKILRLKPNYKFHFYCTHAPCGDASFAAIVEGDTGPGGDQRINTSGILQTKLESGSGTIPVESIVREQKIEDITAKKERYQVMSCSDKLVMWNILGIQGSLLNYFIEPVYFHSIILGQPYQLNHIAYSLYNRVESSLGTLPSSFALHRPQMAHASTVASKAVEPPQKISINWTHGLRHPELLNPCTGKPTDGYVSRLAKRSFFQRFTKLYNALLKQPSLSNFYDSVKKSSPGYEQAKDIAVKAFVSNKLGIWKRKPKEQDAFEISF